MSAKKSEGRKGNFLILFYATRDKGEKCPKIILDGISRVLLTFSDEICVFENLKFLK